MARWYVIQQRSGLALHAGAEPHPAIRLAGPFDDAEIASRVLMERINERRRAYEAWTTVVVAVLVLLIGVLIAHLVRDEDPPRDNHPIQRRLHAAEPDYSPNPNAEVFAHVYRPRTATCID